MAKIGNALLPRWQVLDTPGMTCQLIGRSFVNFPIPGLGSFNLLIDGPAVLFWVRVVYLNILNSMGGNPDFCQPVPGPLQKALRVSIGHWHFFHLLLGHSGASISAFNFGCITPLALLGMVSPLLHVVSQPLRLGTSTKMPGGVGEGWGEAGTMMSAGDEAPVGSLDNHWFHGETICPLDPYIGCEFQ